MLRTTLRGMLHRKLRLLLSGLAVILGVTFIAGSLVLNDTLGRSFDNLFADAYAGTDVYVHGVPRVAVSELEGEEVPPALPGDTVDRVAAVPGVESATGVVEVDGARVIDSEGKAVTSFGPPQLGTNWTGEDEVVTLREGRGPTADDEIAIDAALAETAGLRVGDEVGVLTREPRRDFTLVGIFGFSGGRDSLGGSQFVAFTDPVAQELMLGEPGAWTGVAVQAEGGVSAEQLRDEVAAALGEGFRVRTGEQIAADTADTLKEGMGFFTNILLGFAGVALFVGIFLIINTFSIIVAQRSRELALTRAIGASRGQMIGSVLLEAAVIGLVASTVGVAAGIGVGALLGAIVADFASLPVAGLAVPATAVIGPLVVGVLVTLVAAVLPALRAARVPPVAAMRESATPDRPLTRLTAAGATVLVAGGALLGWGLADGSLWGVLGGVLLCFIGAALLTPLLARPVVSLLGRVFSWSVPGKLGRLNSGRNPRRTAITASALMVGVALVAGFNVVLDSAKASMTAYVEENIQVELVITGEQTGPRPPSFDPAVLERAAALPDVRTIAGVYTDRGLVDGEQAQLYATNDHAALGDIYSVTPVAGDLTGVTADQVAIDTTVADDRGLTVGDPVTVQLSRGDPHTLTVAAVYEEGDLPGRYLLAEDLTDDMEVPQPFMGFVAVTDGGSVAAVESAVAELLADSPEVSVADPSVFLEQQTEQLDTLFIMIQALLGLAILIAVLGIINTLALSVIERTRELGMLRAVGLTRGATMRMMTVESVVISLFGALLGVAVGVGLGTAVVDALEDQGVTTLAIPWQQLGVYLALAAVVGVIAAGLPALRAARVDVLRAIAYE